MKNPPPGQDLLAVIQNGAKFLFGDPRLGTLRGQILKLVFWAPLNSLKRVFLHILALAP